MKTPRGTVVREVFESKLLRGNPLGDPAARETPVYLPPGYGSSARRYPVVFVLSGFTGKGTMLLNLDGWTPNLAERMDRLIAAGRCAPMILVLPDCFTKYGGSQYLDSSATGRYEQYLIRELVPHVDRTWRTLGDGHRGVAGKSSGGYGAMVLGMRHPDVFAAVACHSGDMYFDLAYRPDFPKFVNGLERAGGVARWWRAFERKVKKEKSDFDVLNILAMSAAYSPDPKARPLPIAWPVDLETGELRQSVWRRWLGNDPVELVRRYAKNLKRLKLLYLDCGTRDEWNLHLGARIFVRRARALGVRVVHQEFDDGHMSVQYRYDVSLPRLARALRG
ncbi:MAG: esterase [Planctomycetes bacterium]|nr:esterase [Planctomycetota bacterium]